MKEIVVSWDPNLAQFYQFSKGRKKKSRYKKTLMKRSVLKILKWPLNFLQDESDDEKPKKRRGAASNIVSGKRTRTPVKRDGAIVDNEDFDDEDSL